ncbi:MAG: hypothetical protein V3S94_09405 [Gammaproteobacteria bacterium]
MTRSSAESVMGPARPSVRLRGLGLDLLVEIDLGYAPAAAALVADVR